MENALIARDDYWGKYSEMTKTGTAPLLKPDLETVWLLRRRTVRSIRDITEVTKWQRNRRRQRRLKIFWKNFTLEAWKVNGK